MSFLRKLFGRHGDSDASLLAGIWKVTFISVSHPFGQYGLELRANGAFKWVAVVPVTEGGEFRVEGSGTWRTEGDALHYKSTGGGAGMLHYSTDEGDLILDHLPGTKVGPGVRCVLQRAQSLPEVP
jgi:hypothetical protein